MDTPSSKSSNGRFRSRTNSPSPPLIRLLNCGDCLRTLGAMFLRSVVPSAAKSLAVNCFWSAMLWGVFLDHLEAGDVLDMLRVGDGELGAHPDELGCRG